MKAMIATKEKRIFILISKSRKGNTKLDFLKIEKTKFKYNFFFKKPTFFKEKIY